MTDWLMKPIKSAYCDHQDMVFVSERPDGVTMSEHLPESFLPPAYNNEDQPHGRHSEADVEDHVAATVILQVVIDPLL